MINLRSKDEVRNKIAKVLKYALYTLVAGNLLTAVNLGVLLVFRAFKIAKYMPVQDAITLAVGGMLVTAAVALAIVFSYLKIEISER